MTFTTGLARNFTQVFMARVGVGIGEAGCAPAAHSLIGDYFPAHRRAIGISLFQAGGIAGVSIGLMVAGAIAHSYGWRAALMVAGLASLAQLGRAPCRERGWQYVLVLGVGGSYKKKQKTKYKNHN